MNKDCSSENGGGFSLSPVELSLLSFAIALVLGENLDEGQRALLGNFLVAVGDNLINLTSGAWSN
ncbi:MAG TPA: hypothetical protein VIK78_07775 [Ruminiclostridium sp.]